MVGRYNIRLIKSTLIYAQPISPVILPIGLCLIGMRSSFLPVAA